MGNGLSYTKHLPRVYIQYATEAWHRLYATPIALVKTRADRSGVSHYGAKPDLLATQASVVVAYQLSCGATRSASQSRRDTNLKPLLDANSFPACTEMTTNLLPLM